MQQESRTQQQSIGFVHDCASVSERDTERQGVSDCKPDHACQNRVVTDSVPGHTHGTVVHITAYSTHNHHSFNAHARRHTQQTVRGSGLAAAKNSRSTRGSIWPEQKIDVFVDRTVHRCVVIRRRVHLRHPPSMISGRGKNKQTSPGLHSKQHCQGRTAAAAAALGTHTHHDNSDSTRGLRAVSSEPMAPQNLTKQYHHKTGHEERIKNQDSTRAHSSAKPTLRLQAIFWRPRTHHRFACAKESLRSV